MMSSAQSHFINIIDEIDCNPNIKQKIDYMCSNSRNRCPLCQNSSAKIYYCTECITHGNFYFSLDHKSKNPNRFAETKINEEAIRRDFGALEEKLKNEEHNVIQKYKLIEQIENKRNRIETIKKAIEEEKNCTDRVKEETASVENKISALKKCFPKFRNRLKTADESIQVHLERINTKKEKINEVSADLRSMRSEMTQHLSSYVFPLTVIEHDLSTSSQSDDFDDLDMLSELEDAKSTHFVGGRWVTNTHHSDTKNYKILSAVLPGSGSYDNFCHKQPPEMTCEGDEKVEESVLETWNVSAGLTHLSQMTNVIACLYGVHLPRALAVNEFNQFSKSEMKNATFERSVGDLNANILYLCASQGLSMTELHPLRPFCNIIKLLDGQQVLNNSSTSFDFVSALVDLAEDNYDFSDAEVDSEWENVTVKACDSIPAYTPPSSSYRILEDSHSNLVSTAASMVSAFKGISPLY